MPPKKNAVSTAKNTLLIKLKRHTTTIFISINNTSDLVEVKQQLVEMVNGTGGLKLNDFDLDYEEDDDIDIPQPSADIIDDDEEEDEKLTSRDDRLQVRFEEIKLALPKDKSLPYVNEWVEIDDIDSNLTSLNINDGDILAFALTEEHFNVLEPSDAREDDEE